jgi:hypothetical protein
MEERTTMTSPWFTKQGLDQWMHIDKEENERRRKLIAEGKIEGFDKIRYGLVSPLPGYFRRGFYDAWDTQDSSVGFVEKKPTPEGGKREPTDAFGLGTPAGETRKAVGLYKVFEGSDDNIFRTPALDIAPKQASTAPPKKKAKPPPGVEAPPLWTKSGQDFIAKYGAAEVLSSQFSGTPEVATASRVDPQWGVWKEDPFEDNAITNILKDLSKKGSQRYGEESQYVKSLKAGELDPAGGEPIRQTIAGINKAIYKDRKKGPLFNTDAIAATMMATNVKPILDRFGFDTTNVDKLIKEREESAMKFAREKSS